jgi:hypothetical protein
MNKPNHKHKHNRKAKIANAEITEDLFAAETAMLQ